MNNSVKRLLALVLTCAMLSVCALAADFTGRADELYDLGLFKGTGTDAEGNPVYSLDAAPTRAEAVTMLVRLLGKEAEATEGEWEVPFTDLSGANAWALPYVGYAYENGLTNGEEATLFGTNNTCSAQMYCTLVLRALGYSDAEGGDFEYDDALTFAAEKGLLDAYLTQGTFLRDEVAAVSYSALVTPLKDSDKLLLDKLVEDGAVDAEAAQPLKDKAALYAEYCALAAKMNAQKDQSIDADFNMSMTMTAAGVSIPMTMEGSQQMRLTENGDVVAAMTMKVTAMEQTQTVETYIKDGVCYVNDGTSKIKTPAEGVTGLPLDSLAESTASPLYYFDSLSKAEAGGKVSYTMSMPGSLLTSLTQAVLSSMGQTEDLSGISFGNTEMTMTFKNDTPESVIMSLPMSMTAEGQTIDIALTVEMTINAMGDDVAVVLPGDLDTYVEAPAA